MARHIIALHSSSGFGAGCEYSYIGCLVTELAQTVAEIPVLHRRVLADCR